MKKKYKSGIYENKVTGVRLKILSKKELNSKANKKNPWPKNTTVAYYTNLPAYGKSRWGINDNLIDEFMSTYKKVNNNKKSTKKQMKKRNYNGRKKSK